MCTHHVKQQHMVLKNIQVNWMAITIIDWLQQCMVLNYVLFTILTLYINNGLVMSLNYVIYANNTLYLTKMVL